MGPCFNQYSVFVCRSGSFQLTLLFLPPPPPPPPSLQEQAEDMGNTAQVENLKRQLEEVEERAELLDKERSKGLSAIRCEEGEGLGTCQIDAR